jgi:NAD(P)-dependent dehydrogenase (short-subunit alcohol dehydrogenase family)
MAKMRKPRLGEPLTPVLTTDQVGAIIAACRGDGFADRRDMALVRVFLATGARLAEIAGLRWMPDETVTMIRDAGGTAMDKTIDVARPAAWEQLVSQVKDEVGHIDYLAAVAGVVNRLSPDTVEELTEEAWDHVLGVDAKGVWLGMKYVIPVMIEQGGGRVVNVSSLAAHRGLQGLASYTAAKGAVEALTRQAAVEYGRQGILANVVAPGTIET